LAAQTRYCHGSSFRTLTNCVVCDLARSVSTSHQPLPTLFGRPSFGVDNPSPLLELGLGGDISLKVFLFPPFLLRAGWIHSPYLFFWGSPSVPSQGRLEVFQVLCHYDSKSCTHCLFSSCLAHGFNPFVKLKSLSRKEGPPSLKIRSRSRKRNQKISNLGRAA
jgi:hypothetical protein